MSVALSIQYKLSLVIRAGVAQQSCAIERRRQESCGHGPLWSIGSTSEHGQGVQMSSGDAALHQ